MRRRQGQLHPWGFLLRQRDGGLAAPPVALVHDHVALGRGTAPPPGAAHAVAGMQQCPLQFITIDDERVSRLHAALTVHCNSSRWPPLVTVEDRSRNGSYLNGSPLRPGAPAVLSSGDVLSLVLCVNPLTQLCFVFEECPVPPPNWPRAANAQEGAGSSAHSGNTAVRRPTATGGDALGAGGAAGAAAGAAPYPVLPVGLPRASGNLNAALSAAAVSAALAAGRGTSRNSRGHRAGRSNRSAAAPAASPAAAATSTASTETLGLVDPLAAAAPHRLSGTGFSEGGVEQWPSGAGPREVTSPQPSLPPASLPQSPDRRRITRQSTGSGVPRSLSPDSSPTSVVGESAHGFTLGGGGGRRHSVPVGGASWDRHDDHWPEPHSPTATPRSRVHNHTVAQVLAALHPNPLYADHLTALELAPGTAPPASPPRSPRSTPLRAPVTGAAARASRPSRRSTGSGMAAADGHYQRHQRHRRSRTAHLGAHLLAFAAAGVAAPADSAVSAARGGISLSRSLPQLLPVDLVGNHQFHELQQQQRENEAHGEQQRLQQHSSAQASGYMSAAAVPSLSSVSDSTLASAGWPVHGLAGSGGSAPATSAATSTSSSSRHSLHSPHSQPSLHSRYLLTGGAEAALNSPRRQRFSTGSGFGPPLPVLPPPPLSSAPSASSAFADPTRAEALAQAQRRPRALSYGSGSFGLEEENSGGGSGGSGTHTALVPRISAPTLDAFGSVSDAPMLTPAPPSAPLLACGSGSGSPRSAPAAAAVIVGGGPRSSRSSASRPQSRLLRVSRPNSPLPGCEGSGGVGSTGFAAAWAAGGAGAASCRGGDVGTAGAGTVDELAYGMDMEGHEGGNKCELLAPLPSSPRFGPGGRGGVGSLSDAASEFGQGASGAGSGVAGAGVMGTATAVPLRRLCSAAVAALAAAAEATASESDTPSEITCKEFSFSSLSRPTLSAPAAASSPPGANRAPCCSPSVPAITLEPAASVPTAAAASVNLEARLHTTAADGGSGGSPRFLRRTVSANDGPQAQTLHRQQQLQLQQQHQFGNASDAFLVAAAAAAGAPPTLRVSASSVRAAAPGPQRSVSAGSHGCSSTSMASSADCAAASEVSGAFPEGQRLQRGGVEAALQHSPQAAMVAVAAAAAQPYGGGAATGGAASSLPTASRQLQCRCSSTGGGGESSGSGTGLSDASMPSPRWAGAHGAGEDGGSSSTPSSGRPQRLAAGRHPNRRLTRYGESLDTPSPRSPAVTSSSHAGAGASPFRHADSYRLAALAALAAASPAAASPVPVPAAAAVAAAATQAAPSWPSPARATRPRGAASPACRRLRLEGAEQHDAAVPTPCSGARSGRSWLQHDLSGGGAVAEPAHPLAPGAVILPVSVARSESEGSALRSAAPPPAWPRAQAAAACPSLPYTPSSLVRYLDSRLGSLAAAAEAAVAEAGEEIGAQLASLEAAAAVAAAGGAAGGGSRSQSRSAAAPGLSLELGLDLDLPALPPIPMPTAIGFGGDGTLGNRRFNAAAPSFRGYQSPEGMLMRAGGGADEALTPRSGHGSVCGSTGGAAAASFDEARGSGAGGDCGRSPVGSSGSCARSCVGNAAAGGAAARLALGRALSTSATVGSPRAGRRAPLAAATDSGCDLDRSPPHKPINSTCATPRKQSPPHKPITSTCATPRKHTPRASFSQSHSQVFHEDQGCDHHHHHGHHRQLSRGGGDCLLLHDQAQGHSRTAAAPVTAARSGSSSQGLPLQPSPSGRPPTAESDTLPLHDAGSGSCGNSSGGGWSAQASSREGYAYAYGSAGWPGEQCYPPAAHYHYQQHQDRQVLQLHSRRVSGGAASTLEAPPPSEVDVARAMSTGRGCDNAEGDGGLSVGMGHAGWGPQAQAAAQQQQQQQRRVSSFSRGSSSSCRPSTSGSGCSSEFWAAAVVPVDYSPAAADGAHGVVQLAVAPAQQRQQQPGPPVAPALSRSGLSPLKVDVRQEDGVPGAEGPATGRLAGSPGSSQLVCGLCAGGLRAAVALTPCGHSFCAECLAGHLGSAVLGGSRVGCPNRCPAFEAVVINHPARRLESKRSNAATATAAPGSRAPARAQPDGQCESSPFEAPAAAAAVAAHAAARASAASTPVRGARGGSDPGPAASPAVRAAGGAASRLRTRMGSRGSGYGPSPSRRREEAGTGSEPGAWSEMLADAALPVPAIRLHLQQGEVLLRALSELLDDTPQIPPPPPPSIPAATATTATTSTAAAAAAAATQAATAAVREARAAVVEWRRVVLDVLGCLGRLALEHVRVREALSAAGASQGCVLALRAVQAQMAAAELCTKGGERSLVDKDGIVKKPTVAEAEKEAEAALVAEERATAQDTSRAACVLLCHLLNPPAPSPPAETGATESEQAVCRQQSNQWALARMGGAEALLALLLPAQELGKGATGAGDEGAAGDGSAEQRRWSGQTATALTALQRMVVGNIMTQTHVAECGSAAVVRTLAAATRVAAASGDEAVQAAALRLLADVARGGDAAHAAVRQMLLEAGALGAALAALRDSVAACGGCNGGREGSGNSGCADGGSAASSGMEVSPVLMAALDAIHVLMGPSEQHVDGSEPPPALQAVVRRELRRLGAPRLLADCVRELRLQQEDEQGEGRAQEEWERASGRTGHSRHAPDGRVLPGAVAGAGGKQPHPRPWDGSRSREERGSAGGDCLGCGPVLRAMAELQARVCAVAGGTGWVRCVVQMLGASPDGVGQAGRGGVDGGGAAMAVVAAHRVQLRLLAVAAGGGFALGAAVTGAVAAMWMA